MLRSDSASPIVSAVCPSSRKLGSPRIAHETVSRINRVTVAKQAAANRLSDGMFLLTNAR